MHKNQFSGKNLYCMRGERSIFSELSFSVNSGEALILKGPNGSGKSSLLRLMAGLLKPKEGVLLWNGDNIKNRLEEHNEGLHYVGHMNPIKPVLTVYENINFWNQFRLPTLSIEQALEKFCIGHLKNVSGRFLSAGQARLLNLARIISSPAMLWLLDEPTTSLDSESLLLLENVIKSHQKMGGIAVISTHAKISTANTHELNLSDFPSWPPVSGFQSW